MVGSRHVQNLYYCPMSKIQIHQVHVEFGDCDPAGIVWFPNFFRWVDASSRHFFAQCGVPRWAELTPINGIIGTPLVDTKANFVRPASYGDQLEVHTSIPEWGEKSFVHRHEIRSGEVVLCEIIEKRVFAIRHPEDPKRIKAVAAPPEIRALCE
jgi:4-hydroxybenzoyl-CoA thioesterase